VEGMVTFSSYTMYQLSVLPGAILRVIIRQWLFVTGNSLSFPVWAGVSSVLCSCGEIQQKVLEPLEVLRGWSGFGGWEWSPNIRKLF
jgi:hypothetical protein